METTTLLETKILLDSDVIRHFIKGDELSRLTQIFPGRFVMLEIVQNELFRSPHLMTIVMNFLTIFGIPVIAFPNDRELLKEYGRLQKTLGIGESACLAYAKFFNQYIASSNLSDIHLYCAENNIKYYTTMDLLLEGYINQVFTEQECNDFIAKVKRKGSKLPCDTIQAYIELKKMKGGLQA